MSRSLLVSTAIVLAACAPARSPDEPAIARIEHAKCGACHVEVRAGTRSREELEQALARHRIRVKLTEEQWSAMIDYLAGHSTAACSTPEGDGGQPVR